MQNDSSLPLFSIICFCKNRATFIRRAIDSVLGQTYSNFEFVVQDGASTDGTLEILQEYAAHDSRIKIVSESDSGPAEAYWKVLQRCTGDYIATCLSDEELLPDALEKAANWFAREPHVGAFTCDGYFTDVDGNIIGDFKAGDFDFVAYLFQRYCPFWPGSFFRRKALLDIGIDREEGWNIGCLEFEIWCRLARDHEVRYVPVPMSKYASHPGQLSNTPANFHEHIDNRLKLIEQIFSADGFYGQMPADERRYREVEVRINQLDQFENNARWHKLPKEQQYFAERIREEKRKLVELHEYKINLYRHRDHAPEMSPQQRRQLIVDELWAGWEGLTGVAHGAEPSDRKLRRKLRLQRFVTERFFLRGPRPLQRALRLAEWLGLNQDTAQEFKSFVEARTKYRQALMYDTTARIYESRGQIGQALEMWRRAEFLNSREIDALACQVALKDPNATYKTLAEQQQRWVDRHIKVDSTAPVPAFKPYDGQRRIRLAYHCSFMHIDTFRYIMRRVVLAHDRSKFEVIAYAPFDLPDDIRSAFDMTRRTLDLSDDAFVEQVRRDRVDILVELTGMSWGNRYAAMAKRCAPVQISHLNHFATTRVPNIDYVLSDDLSTPVGSDAEVTFSEQIWRLPDCLLRYDYTDATCPPVGDAPCLANGFVTFACFGGAYKVNIRMVELWAEIMQRVPGSKMMFQHSYFDPPDNRRYLFDRFRRYGISADRVIIRPGTTREGILKAYGETDISMDTWPYCGGNTIAEALWQGVPVVTLKGSMFYARYGASLLKQAGCEELIAADSAAYVRIAAELAMDPNRLQKLRASMRDRYIANGLNDSVGFARNVEAAYFAMVDASPIGRAAAVTRFEPKSKTDASGPKETTTGNM